MRGSLVIPAGSTADIPVSLPFTPQSVYVVACPSSANSSSRGVLTAPDVCNAIQKTSNKIALGQYGYNESTLLDWLFWIVDFDGVAECGGTGEIVPSGFTLKIDTNTLTAPAAVMWEALE